MKPTKIWLLELLSTSSIKSTTGLGNARQKAIMAWPKLSKFTISGFFQIAAYCSFSADLISLSILPENIFANDSSSLKGASPTPSKLVFMTKYRSDNLRQIILKVVVFPYCRARLMVKYSPKSISSSIDLKRLSV